MPPQLIDEVLTELNHIISEAAEQRRRLGYFVALYRDVTARVDAAIEGGEFQDDARMVRLDVAFAQRYLDALKARGTEAGPPHAWARTFQAAERWRPLILQHLLLGINAHVNLDLGIAAAEGTPAPELPGLLRDDAWDFARRVASAEPNRRDALVQAKDRETARRTENILHPEGLWLVPALTWIRL